MEPYMMSVMSNVSLGMILSLPVLGVAMGAISTKMYTSQAERTIYSKETDMMLNEALRTSPINDDPRLLAYWVIFMEPYIMNTFRDFTEIGLAITFAGLGVGAAMTGSVMLYGTFRNIMERRKVERKIKYPTDDLPQY